MSTITDLPAVQEQIENSQKMRQVFAARPLLGERFSVPRPGKLPVDVILHRPARPGPLFLNMHGGGFCWLDAVCMESFCQLLCQKLGYFVVNVNYRLSPEVAFPYAIEEVCDTARYFSAHAAEYGIDPTRVGIGGHSAGAALAAGAALKARDEGSGFQCQMLVYPVTDLTTPLEGEDETGLTLKKLYIQDGDPAHLWASPLLAADEQLKGVCPAIFVTCGPDSLRPQGEAYAKRLIDCGVPVSIRRYEDAQHGFIEVNRPDFFFEDDPRRTPEQEAMCRDAEDYLCGQLGAYL